MNARQSEPIWVCSQQDSIASPVAHKDVLLFQVAQSLFKNKKRAVVMLLLSLFLYFDTQNSSHMIAN